MVTCTKLFKQLNIFVLNAILIENADLLFGTHLIQALQSQQRLNTAEILTKIMILNITKNKVYFD